jgi:CHAD domain-containing protein
VFLSQGRRAAEKTLLSAAADWKAAHAPFRARKKAPPPQELARTFTTKLKRQYMMAGKVAASKLTDSDNEALHRFRIITKKLRYSLELVETEPLEHLQQIQTILGDMNDCHAIIRLLDGRVPKMGKFLTVRASRKLLEFQEYWRNNMTIKRKTS